MQVIDGGSNSEGRVICGKRVKLNYYVKVVPQKKRLQEVIPFWGIVIGFSKENGMEYLRLKGLKKEVTFPIRSIAEIHVMGTNGLQLPVVTKTSSKQSGEKQTETGDILDLFFE